MKFKLPLLTLCIAGLLGFACEAQAGALRATGKAIKDGSTQLASATASGASAAAGSATSVAGRTGDAIKTGTISAGKGAAAAPGVVWHGTKKAAHGFYKAIW